MGRTGRSLEAVPSNDGKGAKIRPHLFRTAVQYRLGVPLLKEEIDYPVCMQKKIDISGTAPLAAHGREI